MVDQRIISQLPTESSDATPWSPAHTDDSGYYSPRGSSSCPPNTRFFPAASDANFGPNTSDEEDDVFTMLTNEEATQSQPELDMDQQLAVVRLSASPLLLDRPRALSFPLDAYTSTGHSLIMRRHLLRRSSASLFWENFRPLEAFQLNQSAGRNSPNGDDIDGEVPDMGPSPPKKIELVRAPEDEPLSDHGASSTASHSPDMFRDEEASWDLPDIVTSGLRPRRKRTLSEADATRMKKLEYRIACRLAQIGDEFDLQMFQTTDAIDGQGSRVLGWIGSSSSAVVTRFWYYITRQGGPPPVGSSRQRSHSMAE
ncbi:hypothetical protein RvY_10031 [Ramazzottius varieornatus]|uniref:Uncharacterized protein n=1 Tax=Ramazzottius varieornatus TaxID=947166 RepID=A0A1D1VFX2_RAMVA|nr:hypothetical protein RvY_10031 [Ramazzottius varieornatus]